MISRRSSSLLQDAGACADEIALLRFITDTIFETKLGDLGILLSTTRNEGAGGARRSPVSPHSRQLRSRARERFKSEYTFYRGLGAYERSTREHLEAVCPTLR